MNCVPENIPEPKLLLIDSDPNACAHITMRGKCRYERMDKQLYCKYHISRYDVNYKPAMKLKRYRLTQHYARVEELALSNDKNRSLTEEIGILNLVLEEIVNQCHTPFDFQVNSQRIESLVDKISKVMMQSHKLESSSGQQLSRQTIMSIVDRLLKRLVEEITDENILKRISAGFAADIDEIIKSDSKELTAKLLV